VTKEKKEKKVDAPILFFVVLFLFFVSFGILVLSLFKQRAVSKGGPRDAVILEEGQKSKDPSLSEYFNEEFTKTNDFESKSFRENDPFREVCGQAPSGNLPSVTSNTVCLY